MIERRRTMYVGAAMAAMACALPVKVCAQGASAPDYRADPRMAGTVRVCGSPQMGDLLKLYEDGFAHVQPGVRFENRLTSTVKAVAGVAAGEAEIGLLGREIWPDETKAFAATRGHAPLVVDIATGSYDVPKATFALMVFVPGANPMRTISRAQLEQVFGAGEGHAAGAGTVHTWGELGMKGEWAARPVHLYGFAKENDKSRIFAQLVFRGDDRWNAALKEFRNAGDVDAGELIVRAVAGDPDAIGISNVHYATGGVKTLAVSEGGEAVAPTRDSVETRRYPLTRAVYMVTDAGASLSPAVREFLRYVLSRRGQDAVVREGNYLPLPAAVARREREALAPAAK